MDIWMKITEISPTSHRKQRKHQSCRPLQGCWLCQESSLLSLSALTLALSRLSHSFFRPGLRHHILRDAVHPGPPLYQSGPSITYLEHPTLFFRSLSLMIAQCDRVSKVDLLNPILHSWKLQVLFTPQSPIHPTVPITECRPWHAVGIP